jgi:NDP-sugar pyrophosphorylase family protein
MRAVILAGGKGTRLRPFTTLIPKPLVPIGGKYSILEIIIMQLSRQGFDHVTIAVNHLSHLIMSYFGDGSRFGIKIDYSLEEDELGTIGPLSLIKDLPDNFLVMNGDILSDINYADLLGSHVSKRAEMSVSSFKRQTKVDFGVIERGSDGNLAEFREKPIFDFLVSMGVYCLNKSAIAHVSTDKQYGFDNLVLDRLSSRRPTSVIEFNGFWLDIGRPEDYQNADENFEELLARLGIA